MEGTRFLIDGYPVPSPASIHRVTNSVHAEAYGRSTEPASEWAAVIAEHVIARFRLAGWPLDHDAAAAYVGALARLYNEEPDALDERNALTVIGARYGIDLPPHAAIEPGLWPGDDQYEGEVLS